MHPQCNSLSKSLIFLLLQICIYNLSYPLLQLFTLLSFSTFISLSHFNRTKYFIPSQVSTCQRKISFSFFFFFFFVPSRILENELKLRNYSWRDEILVLQQREYKLKEKEKKKEYKKEKEICETLLSLYHVAHIHNELFFFLFFLYFFKCI